MRSPGPNDRSGASGKRMRLLERMVKESLFGSRLAAASLCKTQNLHFPRCIFRAPPVSSISSLGSSIRYRTHNTGAKNENVCHKTR